MDSFGGGVELIVRMARAQNALVSIKTFKLALSIEILVMMSKDLYLRSLLLCQ